MRANMLYFDIFIPPEIFPAVSVTEAGTQEQAINIKY